MKTSFPGLIIVGGSCNNSLHTPLSRFLSATPHPQPLFFFSVRSPAPMPHLPSPSPHKKSWFSTNYMRSECRKGTPPWPPKKGHLGCGTLGIIAKIPFEFGGLVLPLQGPHHQRGDVKRVLEWRPSGSGFWKPSEKFSAHLLPF